VSVGFGGRQHVSAAVTEVETEDCSHGVLSFVLRRMLALVFAEHSNIL
jgi:hypothetical protein